jgi:ComF family protein
MNTCHICLQKLYSRHLTICPACWQELPWLDNVCRTCAAPVIQPSTSPHCGKCLQKQPLMRITLAAVQFVQPVQALLYALKFSQKHFYAETFSAILLAKIISSYQQQPLPEILLPIPLHNKRLRQRGYNQVLEIAKPLAKQLAIPLRANLAKRIRYTPPQAQQPLRERERNLKYAFAIEKNVTGRRIALIDDVYTTGATIQACCAALIQQGAATIDVWCCARTPSKHIDIPYTHLN